MALISCNECGSQVSDAAKSCPQCGAKGKTLVGQKKPGKWGKTALGFFGVFILAGVVGNIGSPPHVQTAAERVGEKLLEKRGANIALYAASLRATMRDPTSLSFDEVYSNDDGSLVCFKYRAKNGYGGTNRDIAAFSPDGGSQNRKLVKMICADKVMKDVTEQAKGAIKLLE
ncbi:zinc ribbon domain-containing protein [Sphingomonas sp. RB3P16]|uniref:zinc ribbon domain-containing protein n=1 Tax=Parasphingomonas frigoris TaxID=3096163 RepID=UPI002FC86316